MKSRIHTLWGKRVIVLGLLLLSLATGALWLDGQQSQLADKMVRLHVLANSDSDEDQALKLQVRDAVLKTAEPLLAQAGQVDNATGILENNLEQLTAVAQETIYREGWDYLVSVQLEETWFPTREYDSFALPAGSYQALRVVIGEGNGHNWWCVVFPPLCLASASETVSQTAQDAGMTDQEVALIAEEDEKYVIKFKAIELWEEFKHDFLGS